MTAPLVASANDVRRTAAVTVAIALGGCSAWVNIGGSTPMNTPEGSTTESRRRDMAECLECARELAAGGGGPRTGGTDLLRGRSTREFVLDTGPNGDTVPAIGNSHIGSAVHCEVDAVTDRYVLLLLARGYEWP